MAEVRVGTSGWQYDDWDGRFSQLPGSQRHAVEFRHGSWYEDDATFRILRDHGAALVWLSDEQMPDAREVTADFVYLRLHGLGPHDDRWKHDCTRPELEPWADAVRDAAADGRDGYVFFNDDHRAKAPANARTFVEMLGDAAFPWE
ncbi:MAG: DUF72 domain-containing protein [Nitriliruptorales bacterium]